MVFYMSAYMYLSERDSRRKRVPIRTNVITEEVVLL